MSIEESNQLQHEIDAYLAASNQQKLRLVLDHGSDITDLRSCVDVRVYQRNKDDYELVSIVTVGWLYDLLRMKNNDSWDIDYLPKDYYSSSGHLIVTSKITAELIVRAILHDYKNGKGIGKHL